MTVIRSRYMFLTIGEAAPLLAAALFFLGVSCGIMIGYWLGKQ